MSGATDGGFLATMARGSHARLAAATVPEQALREAPASPRPFDVPAFGLIAEVKLRAPSAGALRTVDDPVAEAVRQGRAYAAAGADAISVLTEPSAFDGHLDHLRAVAAAVDVPVMRKDFLVDPYQVWEAREAGASGVLLIVRMLDDAGLSAMLEAARQAGLFALIECFDGADLARVPPDQLVGINTRDLVTLEVRAERLEALIGQMPPGSIPVAESGMRTPDDTAAARAMGYRLALVGTALMQSTDPGRLVKELRG